MPTLTGEEIANLKILLNGQASAVDFRIQQTIDEDHAGDSVPTVEDLPDGITPGQENWEGRSVLVVADQQVYIITSLPSTWVRLNYLDRATTTPTRGAGWDTPFANDLVRRGGFSYLQFNAVRNTALGVGGVVVEIPAGYRGDLHCWTEGWAADDPASGSYQIFYNPVVHEVQTREVIPDGASLAVSLQWPIV